MTTIAITAEAPSLDAKVDPRFGRAAGFMIIDSGSGDSHYVSNASAAGMAGGAGIHAAETIAKAGARILLTGRVGPKAQSALAAAGIAIDENCEGLTVRQAVERYTAEHPATT
ncbi:MAG: NifB/NifX family molybdenum-iron cluster-binding protein [Rhodospirillales bacterium]|jgi:predicted Fe-Mo cluster-binding NifX family protein|nr:NifB/NifX family molybdenum-iron cluster-binding protein [Rhodospirillales bacterium]